LPEILGEKTGIIIILIIILFSSYTTPSTSIYWLVLPFCLWIMSFIHSRDKPSVTYRTYLIIITD